MCDAQKKLFPFSVLAERAGNYITHSTGLVEAENADEAHGIAHRIAQRCFPQTEGWYRHHVKIGQLEPIDPDACIAV